MVTGYLRLRLTCLSNRPPGATSGTTNSSLTPLPLRVNVAYHQHSHEANVRNGRKLPPG